MALFCVLYLRYYGNSQDTHRLDLVCQILLTDKFCLLKDELKGVKFNLGDIRKKYYPNARRRQRKKYQMSVTFCEWVFPVEDISTFTFHFRNPCQCTVIFYCLFLPKLQVAFPRVRLIFVSAWCMWYYLYINPFLIFLWMEICR